MRPPTAPLSIGLSVGVAVCLLLSVVALPVEPAQSRERDRTLKLFFGHTGERGTFTFKRNGRYDRKELQRINHFLRDWRKDEAARMDPQLLDLVWDIYDESGSRGYIHIVSAYRSPATNSMLRNRSSGVAKNSQHTSGKAMDFAIPDVPLDKLRAIAMRRQGGGVGYYPRSGFPFVHVDTGSVRAWPRMSRQQLLALFPDGETLHLPPDGKPLPGHQRALARSKSSGETTLAYLEAEPEEVDRTGTTRGVGAWLKRVFPGDGKGKDELVDEGTPADAPAPEREAIVAVTEDALEPRRPRARPAAETDIAATERLLRPAHVTPADAEMIATLAFAPLPRTRPDPVFLAASLGDAPPPGATPLPVGADAIALFVSGAAEPAQGDVEVARSDPVTIAFSAVENDRGLPSDEDRATLAAFAARRAQSATAPAALAYEAAQPREVVLAAAVAAPTRGTATTGTGEPALGVVLAPDGLPSYREDRDAIRSLIATPATYDPRLARLEMPVPGNASAIYQAPRAADEVSELSHRPDLPVDRFSIAESSKAPDERGFFMRLFASLIE